MKLMLPHDHVGYRLILVLPRNHGGYRLIMGVTTQSWGYHTIIELLRKGVARKSRRGPQVQ